MKTQIESTPVNKVAFTFPSCVLCLSICMQFAVHVTKCLPTPDAMVDHLSSSIKKLEEMRYPKAHEPILFLQMHVAQHKIELVS